MGIHPVCDPAKAGQTYTVPRPGDKATLTVQAPFGAEAIKAVMSTQPFEPAWRAGRCSPLTAGAG